MNLTMGVFRALTSKIEDGAEIVIQSGEFIEIERRQEDGAQIIMRIHLATERLELYGTDFILRVVGHDA